MKKGIYKILAKTVICALLATAATRPAAANSIPTSTDVVWIGVAVAAIGAGIGVGIFYAIHHGESLTGCTASGANGLALQNKDDQQTYSLVGEVATIRPGERVRVTGKRVKKSAPPQFLVEHVKNDFGACTAKP